MYVNARIKPTFDYYKEHLKADLMNIPTKAYNADQLFSSHYFQKTKPECTRLMDLLAFSLILMLMF